VVKMLLSPSRTPTPGGLDLRTERRPSGHCCSVSGEIRGIVTSW
jgi:hypothetical protein